MQNVQISNWYKLYSSISNNAQVQIYMNKPKYDVC